MRKVTHRTIDRLLLRADPQSASRKQLAVANTRSALPRLVPPMEKANNEPAARAVASFEAPGPIRQRVHYGTPRGGH